MRTILRYVGVVCVAVASIEAAIEGVGPAAVERVSLTGGGTEIAAESSFSVTSADGRYVAFYSNERGDVLVRDRVTQLTEVVSVGPNGEPADNPSGFTVAISADGRFVAFESYATNLVPGDDPGCAEFPCDLDVYVRDRATGTTERIGLTPTGSESLQPSMSADGRVVAYVSVQMLQDGTFRTGLFVRDRLTGVDEKISGGGFQPSVSADGRFVAFVAQAETFQGVSLYDRSNGTTRLVSVAVDGGDPDSNSEAPAISPDGRFVAFLSDARNLVAKDLGPSTPHVFVRDLVSGTTDLVSTGCNGPGDLGASRGIHGVAGVSISGDGGLIAFTSASSNLVDFDVNLTDDVFIRDRVGGTTRLISAANPGTPANGPSSNPALSADGRIVAFTSAATNLVPGDNNLTLDVFAAGTTGIVLQRPTSVSYLVSVQEVDVILEIECLPEPLAVRGTVHDVVTTIQDASGRIHQHIVQTSQRLTANGLVSGATYQFVTLSTASGSSTFSLETPSSEAATFVRRFSLAGSGPAAGSKLEVTSHLTVNTNGQTTVNFLRIEGVCPL